MTELTQENYFDYPALSASGINTYLQKGAFVYWAHSPFNPNKVDNSNGDDTLLGSVTHCLVLEGYKKFESTYFIAEEGMRKRTKAWLAMEDEAAGRQIIRRSMYEDANKLATALLRHERVQQLLCDGTAETPILWEKDGIKCKLKADYLKGRGKLIIDYKTTRATTSSEYYRAAAEYGYHRAAAWYFDGVAALTGEEPEGFLHVVQNKDYPEIIGFHEITGEMMEVGRAENEFAFKQIKGRLISGDWATWTDNVEKAELPYWYRAKGAHQ